MIQHVSNGIYELFINLQIAVLTSLVNVVRMVSLIVKRLKSFEFLYSYSVQYFFDETPTLIAKLGFFFLNDFVYVGFS